MREIKSKEKFISLVNTYQNLVFSLCLKMTGDYFVAEDLAQDTFLAVFEKYDEFDGREEKAWICRIASNKCIDYARAKARKTFPTEEEKMPDLVEEKEKEPLEQILNMEVLEEFLDCCNRLSSPYKEVALQFFADGKTAREISETMGVKLKTVQTQIYRARASLQKSYGKEWRT